MSDGLTKLRTMRKRIMRTLLRVDCFKGAATIAELNSSPGTGELEGSCYSISGTILLALMTTLARGRIPKNAGCSDTERIALF